jgi:hypothetical protein
VLGAVINAAPPHKGFMGSYGYYYHHSYYKLDYGAHDRQVQESDKE